VKPTTRKLKVAARFLLEEKQLMMLELSVYKGVSKNKGTNTLMLRSLFCLDVYMTRG
jgi:hypothetical protein